MYKASKSSVSKLTMAHKNLVLLFCDVLDFHDVGISYSYRDARTQNDLVLKGASKLRFPDSAHNKKPSLAIDFILYVDGIYVRGESESEQKMYHVVRDKFYECAKARSIKLKPLIIFKNGAKDLGHIELDLR